jgi:soluble lytic murein transglycosylase-like protein
LNSTPITREALITAARAAAERHGLDAALVCAVVEQESGWNQWATRYEPAFRIRYVAPLGLPVNEEISRSISWGLMQVMGQVAREAGFHGTFLSELCDPETCLEWGCTVLAKKLVQAGGDPGKGLQLWNGGGNANYSAQVFARTSQYQTA